MVFYQENKLVFFKRLAAYFIDAFLCSISAIILLAILGLGFQFTESGPTFLVYLIYASYYVFMFGKYGQSFGYKFLKLKISKEDGASVDYKFAFYRLLATSLSSLIFFVGHFMILFNNKKQALQDKLTNIVVIEY